MFGKLFYTVISTLFIEEISSYLLCLGSLIVIRTISDLILGSLKSYNSIIFITLYLNTDLGFLCMPKTLNLLT